MMKWTNEISSVESASRASEEELREEIKMYQKRVENLNEKVLEEADEELRENVGGFLKVSLLKESPSGSIYLFLKIINLLFSYMDK